METEDDIPTPPEGFTLEAEEARQADAETSGITSRPDAGNIEGTNDEPLDDVPPYASPDDDENDDPDAEGSTED